MKFSIILVLGVLFSLSGHAGVSDLVGKSYDNFNRDFPNYYSGGGSCLLDCKYSMKSIRLLDGKAISLVLSKRGSIRKWDIVDVLKNVSVKGEKSYAQVFNCTKSFSTFRKRYGFSTSTMPSEENLVALVQLTGKEKTKEELWVNATKAFVINESTMKFEEISKDDVFCYVGIG